MVCEIPEDWLINSSKQMGFRFDSNLRKPCLESLGLKQDMLTNKGEVQRFIVLYVHHLGGIATATATKENGKTHLEPVDCQTAFIHLHNLPKILTSFYAFYAHSKQPRCECRWHRLLLGEVFDHAFPAGWIIQDYGWAWRLSMVKLQSFIRYLHT